MTIREGPITCYWCRESIPYTIDDNFWYCWECGRHTREDYIGKELSHHFCGKLEVISPENIVVMLKCVSDSPYPCPNDLITISQVQYQADLYKRELRNSWYTKEWHDKVQATMQEYKERLAIKQASFVASHPVLKDPESDVYKASFARFEERMNRKEAKRADRKMLKRLKNAHRD